MQERKDLNQSIAELAIASIQAHNKDDAEKYVLQLVGETAFSRGIMTDMINLILTYVGKEFGEEKVKDAWMYTCKNFWKPIVENFKHCHTTKSSKPLQHCIEDLVVSSGLNRMMKKQRFL